MDLESASDSEIEFLSQTLEKLNIPTYNLKMEENLMVEAVASTPVEIVALDIPESSHSTRFMRPRHSRTPTARGTTSFFGAVKQETDLPMDNLRPEGINPFCIYLDLDCKPNISSTLDRWETSIRLAIVVNHMTNDDAKRYIGMPMIKFALQFWQNLKTYTKAQALEGDNITDLVAKVVHLLRIEFLREGYIDRDSPQYVEKYVHCNTPKIP